MIAPDQQTRFPVDKLRTLSSSLFMAAGLDQEKAETITTVLIEGDLLGRGTHGLGLVPRYLNEIANGSMMTNGEPEVISDRGACVAWDGKRLPGVWLTSRAMALAVERAVMYGTVTVAIGNACHAACLAAYLPTATDHGLMAILASSDPAQSSVAPFGGTRGLFTPNPIAVGIPTAGDPILIDTSTSTTTNNMVIRLNREHGQFDHPWLQDASGQATRDPAVIAEGGTILPAGGLDHGHKGYSWAVMVEALTQGLSGFGRFNEPKQAGNCVFVQVIDPAAFAGLSVFEQQMENLVMACKTNPPRPGIDAVRLPGERSLERKRQALENGVELTSTTVDDLQMRANQLGVAFDIA